MAITSILPKYRFYINDDAEAKTGKECGKGHIEAKDTCHIGGGKVADSSSVKMTTKEAGEHLKAFSKTPEDRGQIMAHAGEYSPSEIRYEIKELNEWVKAAKSKKVPDDWEFDDEEREAFQKDPWGMLDISEEDAANKLVVLSAAMHKGFRKYVRSINRLAEEDLVNEYDELEKTSGFIGSW